MLFRSVLLVLFCALPLLISSAPTLDNFGVADAGHCASIGWNPSVYNRGVAAAQCANDIVSANIAKKRSVIRNALSAIPPAVTNGEFLHATFCASKDEQGDEQYFFNYVVSNSSTHVFENNCPEGFHYGAGSVMIKPRYNVTGVITTTSLAPIAGATVTVGDLTFTTGADGSYFLNAINGTYTATVAAEGFRPATYQVVVAGNTIKNFKLLAPYVNQTVIISLWAFRDSATQPNELYAQSHVFGNSGCEITKDVNECACFNAKVDIGEYFGGDTVYLRDANNCEFPYVHTVTLLPPYLEVPLAVIIMRDVNDPELAGQNTETIAQIEGTTANFADPSMHWRIFSQTADGVITIHNDFVANPTSGLATWDY